MAENHVRAVQKFSQIEDDLTRHIVEVIALDIGRDDSPASTSLRKIAARVRCAVNTAQEKIAHAVESGELIQQKDGKYYVYSINPELIPYGRTSKRENGGKVTDKLLTTADLEEMEKRLYQRLYQDNRELYQKLYQQIVSIVSVDRRGADTEEYISNSNGSSSEGGNEEILQLSNYFQSITGCLPDKNNYDNDWEPVLADWINRYGLPSSEKVIDNCVSFARGNNDNRKKYLITSPRSLVNIAANMPTSSEVAANGTIRVSAR